MYSNSIQNLINKLSKLPSIGPRQASRIAFYLLKNSDNLTSDLAKALNDLKENVKLCPDCFLSYESKSSTKCSICSDERRKKNTICILQKEIEIKGIESSGAFKGLYHIIGEGIDVLKKDNSSYSTNKLIERVKKLKESYKDIEIIIATNQTTEGVALAMYIEDVLKSLNVHTTTLGKGLSSGNELEYADKETIMHALNNRK